MKSPLNVGSALWLMTLVTVNVGCSNTKEIINGISPRENTHLHFESDPLSHFVVYNGFVVSYDTSHKVPSFVIHHLAPQQISDSVGIRAQRSDVFYPDPRLGKTSATKADYYRSGYDRGHHAPAGDFVYSQRLKDETFVFTNMSPQKPRLNRSVFATLEGQIRDKVQSCQCDAYVITGTLFINPQVETIGQGAVGIPSHLYKMAYFPSKNRVYAFYFPNYLETYDQIPRSYQVTVDEIESLTHEDFFDRLPDELEEKLEQTKRRL